MHTISIKQILIGYFKPKIQIIEKKKYQIFDKTNNINL